MINITINVQLYFTLYSLRNWYFKQSEQVQLEDESLSTEQSIQFSKMSALILNLIKLSGASPAEGAINHILLWKLHSGPKESRFCASKDLEHWFEKEMEIWP